MGKYALGIVIVVLGLVAVWFHSDWKTMRETMRQTEQVATDLRVTVHDLEAQLHRDEQEQERLGKVLVMLSNGWYAWPTVPACEYQGRVILNVPCHEIGFVIGEGHPLTTPPDAIDPGASYEPRTKWGL